MSALTKTFILLHVVMSMLLAAGLVVFVNRLDASATATKTLTARLARVEEEKNIAVAEAQAATTEHAAIREQARNQVATMQAELTKANQDNLALRGQLAELQSHAAQDKAALAAAMEAQRVAQQNQGTLQGQLADLRTSQDRVTQQLTEANLSINDLRNRLETTERARQQVVEELASVRTQLQDTPQGGGRARGFGDDAIIANSRERIEGAIAETRNIAGRPYATLTIGANDAVRQNMRLSVVGRNGQFLGYVTVTKVDQEEAVGVLSGPRISEIRANDRVTNQLLGQG